MHVQNKMYYTTVAFQLAINIRSRPLMSNTNATPTFDPKRLVWCPDPSQNICARVNACGREGEKGLVNNYASPRAKEFQQPLNNIRVVEVTPNCDE